MTCWSGPATGPAASLVTCWSGPLPGTHREGGKEHPARIVVYRRPLEIRAADRDDLADLVRDVVVDQVAVLLGRDPEEIDPTS